MTGATPRESDAASGAEAGEPRADGDAPRADGVFSARFRWLSLGMFALVFLAAFETLAVTTVMPLIADDLDGWSLFAVAFAIPLAAGVVGMVIAGNWSDRGGPMAPLIASAIVWLIGVVIAGTATTMVVFVIGRFVHGFAGAAVIVPLYVIVARIYPERLRSRVFAGFAAAWVIPSIIGPTLAGLVAEATSWHWVFLGVAVLALPISVMVLMPLARARHELAGDHDVPWSASRILWSLLAAGAALGLGLAKDLGDPWRWIAAPVAIVVVLIAVRPLLPPGTLSGRRGLPATVLMRAIVAAAFFATEVYLPAFFRDTYEMRPSLAGAVLTGAGVSWAIASWLQGRLDRVPNTRIVRIGSGLLLVALVVVLGGSVFAWHPAIGFAAWTIAGFGMGFMYPRFSVAVLELSPKREQGFNSSALTIGESLGASVSIAVTALVASAFAFDWYYPEFTVTVVVALVALFVAGRVRPPGVPNG
ncbi:MFS transporter [Agromyces aerolatus]|uniref:MFS transporter n=1 Tax=Agromyces sp. LY-1074 TaxID=3074080 RepID=UPI00285C46DD|nr:MULTISPECIES: MFS transporter [unclassified Agromyces]MDR5699513.1 MFS transporter [Agromyces sp. LY-1074]MDR5705809.1 MFS transporter [Agromyces sp. LY-1358]